MNYSPWGHKELDMTKWLTLSLSFISLEPEEVPVYAFLTMRVWGIANKNELWTSCKYKC